MNPLQKQIEALLPEEKVILDKIDAGDNKYWKSNRNHDMGYNKALSLTKQSLPKIIELIQHEDRLERDIAYREHQDTWKKEIIKDTIERMKEKCLEQIKCTQDIDGGVCDCCEMNYYRIEELVLLTPKEN